MKNFFYVLSFLLALGSLIWWGYYNDIPIASLLGIACLLSLIVARRIPLPPIPSIGVCSPVLARSLVNEGVPIERLLCPEVGRFGYQFLQDGIKNCAFVIYDANCDEENPNNILSEIDKAKEMLDKGVNVIIRFDETSYYHVPSQAGILLRLFHAYKAPYMNTGKLVQTIKSHYKIPRTDNFTAVYE